MLVTACTSIGRLQQLQYHKMKSNSKTWPESLIFGVKWDLQHLSKLGLYFDATAMSDVALFKKKKKTISKKVRLKHTLNRKILIKDKGQVRVLAKRNKYKYMGDELFHFI